MPSLSRHILQNLSYPTHPPSVTSRCLYRQSFVYPASGTHVLSACCFMCRLGHWWPGWRRLSSFVSNVTRCLDCCGAAVYWCLDIFLLLFWFDGQFVSFVFRHSASAMSFLNIVKLTCVQWISSYLSISVSLCLFAHLSIFSCVSYNCFLFQVRAPVQRVYF